MIDWISTALTALAVVGVLVSMLGIRASAYRQGIWDGAFNMGLPHVQAAMLEYDRERAIALLEQRGIPVRIGDADPLGREHDAR